MTAEDAAALERARGKAVKRLSNARRRLHAAKLSLAGYKEVVRNAASRSDSWALGADGSWAWGGNGRLEAVIDWPASSDVEAVLTAIAESEKEIAEALADLKEHGVDLQEGRG